MTELSDWLRTRQYYFFNIYTFKCIILANGKLLPMQQGNTHLRFSVLLRYIIKKIRIAAIMRANTKYVTLIIRPRGWPSSSLTPVKNERVYNITLYIQIYIFQKYQYMRALHMLLQRLLFSLNYRTLRC